MSDLPDKSGNYYWRESDGDEWTEFYEVKKHGSELWASQMLPADSTDEPAFGLVDDLGGQWLPIPTAEELVELQAKAKAYDEGREQWQIWDPCHSKIEMVGRTENEAIKAFRKSIPSSNPPEPWSQYLAAGYTCEPVTIIRKAKR